VRLFLALIAGQLLLCSFPAHGRDPMFDIGIDEGRRYPGIESRIPYGRDGGRPYWMDDERILYNRRLGRDEFKQPDDILRWRDQKEIWVWDLRTNTHSKVMDGGLECYADGWATVVPNLPGSTPREVSPKLNGPLGGEMRELAKEQWEKGYFNKFSCRFFPGNPLELRPGRFTHALHEEHGYLDIRDQKANPFAHLSSDNAISFYPKGASAGIPIQLRKGIMEFGRVDYYPFAAAYLVHGEINGNNSYSPPTNPLVRLLHTDGRVQEFAMPDELWRLRRTHTFAVQLTRRGLLWSVWRYRVGGVGLLDEGGVLKRIRFGGEVSPNGCRIAGIWSPSSGKEGAGIEIEREHREGRLWLVAHDIC
jgi:hypothetical protein